MPVSLKCGIVGLPNVGKSTLFNALTKAGIAAENYPFCTIEPNVGIVEIPDPRLAALAAIAKPQKVIPATVEFVDIAGLVAGASKGEGLGNQFLAQRSAKPTRSPTSSVASKTRTSFTSAAGSIRSATSKRSTPSWRSPISRRSTSRSRRSRSSRAQAATRTRSARSRVLSKVRTALNAGQARAHRRSLRRGARAAEAVSSS